MQLSAVYLVAYSISVAISVFPLSRKVSAVRQAELEQRLHTR